MGFPIVPAIICLIMVIILGRLLVLLWKGGIRFFHNLQSPLETRSCRLISKRTHISGGEYRVTRYFVTFEFEDGKRLEFRVKDQEYGLLAEGDEGELSFKGSYFIAFDRKERVK